MCTAMSFLCREHYFGRNLDLEYCYEEAVTVTPRNFPFYFRHKPAMPWHYGMIGTATVSEGFPLYYEATNEKGLSVAGLNFPHNAVYGAETADAIAPFELIPWLLGQCATVSQCKKLLQKQTLGKIPFSPDFPLGGLHWLVADRQKSMVIEPGPEGLRLYDDPVGVLTNNPPFPYHRENLKNYMMLSPSDPENRLAPGMLLQPYSRGMGAMGLPGDLSSASRYIRCAFTKLHSIRPEENTAAVGQFFHILETVSQTEGCVQVGKKLEKTVYTCCCNTDRGIYYYTTYENRQISAVAMRKDDLDGTALKCYPLLRQQQIRQAE